MAQMLAPGAVIALEGELGAGKTQFVRGLVKGLGGSGQQVTSPTFVLLNVYETPKMSVYHLDAYRTAGADDLEAVGFLELLDQKGLVVVEWASRIADLLPAETIRVQLAATGPRRRQIEINGFRHRRPATPRRA
jgi:tRNA threonylcarbamoyladenosine biosynthesis protein TsaE